MAEALTIPPIVHRVYIKAPAAQVFAAITTSEGWNAWFTQATTIDLRLGGLVTLRWRDWGPDHDTVDDGGGHCSISARPGICLPLVTGIQTNNCPFYARATRCRNSSDRH